MGLRNRCSRPWRRPVAEVNQVAPLPVVARTDALAHFGPDPFWPGHPLDDQRRHSGIYYGATGVVWGLEYLRRIGAIDADFDFKPHLPQLLTNIQADMTTYGDYATHGSLLAGDMGTALVAMRLAPSAAMAELIYTRADANTRLPIGS